MQNVPYLFLAFFFFFLFPSFYLSCFFIFLFSLFFSHAIPNLTSVCYKIVHPLYIIWIDVDITKNTPLVNNKKKVIVLEPQTQLHATQLGIHSLKFHGVFASQLLRLPTVSWIEKCFFLRLLPLGSNLLLQRNEKILITISWKGNS